MRKFLSSFWARLHGIEPATEHAELSSPVKEGRPAATVSREEIRSVLKSELAHYVWGTGKIWFAEHAAVSHLTPAKIFADLSHGVGPWSNSAEFRQTVAVLHEIVHYLQDISTGVGHWDYVLRTNALKKLMTHANSDSHTFKSFPPATSSSGQKLYEDAFSSSFYDAYVHRGSELRTQLEKVFSQGPQPTEPDYPDLLSIVSVMEAEAVTQVFRTVEHFLTLSDEARKVRDDHAYLYEPFAMSDEYKGLHDFLRVQICSWAGILDQHDLKAFEEETGTSFRGVVYGLYLNLFDVCFAHPPPSYFASTGRQRSDFHPGVKLVHLLRGFSVGAIDLNEEGILAACAVKYPQTKEVNQMWIDYFRSEPAFANDPVAQLRIKLCELKRDSTKLIAKTLNTPLFYEAPLTYEIQHHPREYVLALNRPARSEYVRQITNRWGWDAVFMSLADWGFLGTPFVCPLAGNCPVMEEKCSHGIMVATDIPRKTECAVRTFLEDEGFYLG